MSLSLRLSKHNSLQHICYSSPPLFVTITAVHKNPYAIIMILPELIDNGTGIMLLNLPGGITLQCGASVLVDNFLMSLVCQCDPI